MIPPMTPSEEKAKLEGEKEVLLYLLGIATADKQELWRSLFAELLDKINTRLEKLK